MPLQFYPSLLESTTSATVTYAIGFEEGWMCRCMRMGREFGACDYTNLQSPPTTEALMTDNN